MYGFCVWSVSSCRQAALTNDCFKMYKGKNEQFQDVTKKWAVSRSSHLSRVIGKI